MISNVTQNTVNKLIATAMYMTHDTGEVARESAENEATKGCWSAGHLLLMTHADNERLRNAAVNLFQTPFTTDFQGE